MCAFVVDSDSLAHSCEMLESVLSSCEFRIYVLEDRNCGVAHIVERESFRWRSRRLYVDKEEETSYSGGIWYRYFSFYFTFRAFPKTPDKQQDSTIYEVDMKLRFFSFAFDIFLTLLIFNAKSQDQKILHCVSQNSNIVNPCSVWGSGLCTSRSQSFALGKLWPAFLQTWLESY